MTTAAKTKGFVPAPRRIHVTPGESVRIMRELQGMTPNELADKTGIPISTITAIEQEEIPLSPEECVILAQALQCDSRVLLPLSS